MKTLAYIRSLAAKIFHRSHVEDDMEEELRSHIEHRTDDLERSGLDRAQAEWRARVEFGGYGRFKEECYEALGGTFTETLIQDGRFSLRLLRKSPGFTIVAVLTLALAIGANAVVFGILNGLILRPLDVPQAESLYGTEYGADPGFQSYPNYRDLRDRNHSFEDLAAFNFAFVGLDTGNEPARAVGFATTGNYFDVLKIQPYLGRFFHSSDEHGPNSAPYLVLSYAYWHSRFQDDRSVIGRTVLLNKHPFTIIGVAPPEFRGTLLFASSDFFMPIVNQEQVNGLPLEVRATIQGIFEAFGHLKPGVTPAQATADVDAVAASLAKTYPKEFVQKRSVVGRVGLTSFDHAVRAFVVALTLLAGLILIAACANLGGLFAARAADRSREVALRLALGSSRNRILRGLLTEAFLISIAGGIAGLLASIALLQRLSVWQPFPSAPIRIPVTPDAKVYAVALALAVVSGLLFGIIPVRQVLRTDPYQIVKSGSAGRTGRRVTLRELLLGMQIAICAVLVTSSMVAVRGLLRSLNANLGIEPRNAILVTTNLAMAGYSGDQVPTMQKRMMAALETIPGVEQVGLANNYPPLIYASANRANVFKKETANLRPSNVAARPYRFEVSPRYFQAAGTSLLAGRDFTWHDDKNAQRVAVVNRDFAGKMFGSVTMAVGSYYKLQDGAQVQVVGVVEDGKYLSLTEDPQPAMFLSFLQSPAAESSLVVRSSGDTQQLISAMRSKVRELDRGLPVDTETWSSMLHVVFFPSRVATMALGVLGTMGAMLSVTGIFGMAAYSVSKRLKELGIRMALGAQRKEVLQAALERAFNLLIFGSSAGLLLGVLASRVLASIVYQATSRDPLVLTGVVLAMALLGLVATWIPAQRALSLDPSRLLREE
ncbi:MAG TPA: ABC transporter permease [Bryobacteraceae bacterium]|jgi:predicted permease